jgi:hypothetical protein
MKIGLLLGLLPPAVLVASSSFASDTSACLDAASKAQTLRDAHKLVEAREQLRLCAAGQCPTAVRADCSTWLAEVEQGLPTVVITATDGHGHDRFDVTVSVDKQAPAIALEGQALPMNPGPHTLHLGAKGATLDEIILVKEGMKNQSVAIVFPLKKEDAAAAAPAASTSRPENAPTENAPTSGRGSSAWRSAGWAIGGVGVVGIAVGAVFGFKAISNKNGAHCDASGACDGGPLADANTSASIATVGVVAGGALVLGGLALVLFGPDSQAAPAAGSGSRAGVTFRLAPLVGAREGGMLVGGRW